MNKTIFLNAVKIDDKSFLIDVLYFSATSYSKSLYPTLTRLFNKYAIEFFSGGSYDSREETIAKAGELAGVITYDTYFIKRVIYTKK